MPDAIACVLTGYGSAAVTGCGDTVRANPGFILFDGERFLQSSERMIAGILKEPQPETRVSRPPEAVAQLTKKTLQVLVENGAVIEETGVSSLRNIPHNRMNEKHATRHSLPNRIIPD